MELNQILLLILIVKSFSKDKISFNCNVLTIRILTEHQILKLDNVTFY